jgi:citrate synthase
MPLFITKDFRYTLQIPKFLSLRFTAQCGEILPFSFFAAQQYSQRKAPMPQSTSTITTAIWNEKAVAGNDRLGAEVRIHGYDVFGQMVKEASLVDMLHLLLTGEAPSARTGMLLNRLAVALANPGPRDPSVYAAMCGGIGGSTAASCLMAALAAGAGRHGGAREVYDCMQLWEAHAEDLTGWKAEAGPRDVDGVWPASTHAAGFDPVSSEASPLVQQTLAALVELYGDGTGTPLHWLQNNRTALEAQAGAGVSMPFVAALAFVSLKLSPEMGELAYLLLRLPGAAAHAHEQSLKKYTEFPFPAVELIEKGAQ